MNKAILHRGPHHFINNRESTMSEEEKKKTVSANRRQVILAQEYCDKAERIGEGNKSKGIRIALDEYEEKRKD